jgi:methionyl-tRNA synthetase
MLKAHGKFVLPENVPANEFLNIEGEKVSTSRNWAVWVNEYLADFPDMQDSLRYVLCANAPETKDNDFTWKDFQTRHNSELVDIFGNFVNRAMVLMHKLCGGKVPAYHENAQTDLDIALIQDIQLSKQKIEASIEAYKFREALFEVIDLARKGNKYLQEVAPWSLAKTPELQAQNQEKIDNCLHIALQLCANLAIFTNPFLPFTAKKICSMLTVVDKMLYWENAGRMDLLKKGYPLRAPELLFRKIDDAEITKQVEKLHAGLVKSAAEQKTATTETKEEKAAEAKATIQFDDFAKIDLRVGTIITAEKVEKADKLLKLAVDMGSETRTIVSGIAMHFTPEEIVGQQVTVVANLAPRKMRGIESQGMILMAEDEAGKLVFVSPKNLVNAGSEVR